MQQVHVSEPLGGEGDASDVAVAGSSRVGAAKKSKSLDPRVAKIYMDKLKKAKVALTGLQLLEKVQKMQPYKSGDPSLVRSRSQLKQDIYRFLREEAVQEGPSFARRDRVKHYQGTLAFKPGVYFVDYGEFHKKWRSYRISAGRGKSHQQTFRASHPGQRNQAVGQFSGSIY